MGKALYRKYRSRSLDEIVGQDHVTSLLSNALKSGRISHAYLLTGPRGTGKTSIARILAHEVNGLPYSDNENLDIIEIDAASNRRIDDIRDLREKVHITPVATTYKVYIIDEVHMLTGESFNALLKTLEEPPEHVIFILATTEAHKVPATILSRTQRYHLRPASEQKVADHLKQMADKEKIKIDEPALKLIAKHGGGSFRDSISLLDQLASTTDHITRDVVESIMGLVPSEQLELLVDAIVHHRTSAVIELLNEILDSDSTAVVLIDQLIEALAIHAAAQPDLYQLIDRLLEVPRAHQPRMKLTAVLAGYAHTHPPKTVAQTAAGSRVITSAPKPVVKQRPAIETATETPVNDTAVVPDPPTPAVASGEFDWTKIMDVMRKHHAPIASVLSRAQVNFSDNTLNLQFPYALHKKRMDQPATQAVVLRVINDVCGFQPTIVVGNGILDNEDTASVAAIMGGGEPVSAPI